MRIVFLTPEVQPFSKTGGLADMTAALARALAQQGHTLTIISPLYARTAQYIQQTRLKPEILDTSKSIWIGDELHQLGWMRLEQDDVEHVFVDNDAYYDRPQLYCDDDGFDFRDNVARFAYFCASACEYLLTQHAAPDIIHVHDWQAALLPVYLHSRYAAPKLTGCKTVLTVHNLGYQGVFPAPEIYATGLDWSWFTHALLEFHGQLNLLKGGVACADALTTVSPSYSKEILTPEFGYGLDGLLRQHASKLTGILNGIDDVKWNPQDDELLPANFSVNKLNGKAKCKSSLQREFGLPTRKDVFLMGIVSRLDRQKGLGLVIEAVRRLNELSFQLVILGTGETTLQAELLQLAEEQPERIAVRIGFDEELAHLIEAGADAFLMPSAYEPCGLNQMYSQRYGTVPIVRETGGLKDTVVNYTPAKAAASRASGFTFKVFSAKQLALAIKRAAKLYYEDASGWRALIQAIMQRDFSWPASAERYLKLYRSLGRRQRQQEAAGG